MEEEKRFHGIRSGIGWISRADLTLAEAQDLIERHLHGANQETDYSLEEEGDHLIAEFSDRNQPDSSNTPGNNEFPKDGVWGTVRGEHSDKRKEYPNR
ncbi:MAG: hypothetical protein JWO30_3708 [Fibrobacteres bacterium]|nr:hypothetical protein [Fibrobacterota bacterium]